MCDTTHSYGWDDSCIYVTWLIYMYDMTHSYVRRVSFEFHSYVWQWNPRRPSTSCAFAIHTTATRYCNTLLQHATATRYCNTLLHYTYCSTLLQHATATHLLQHTSAPHYCTTQMQRHTTATNCYIILPGPYCLAHICNTNNWNTPLQQTYCNRLTATHLLQHTTAPRLLHHTNTTTRYGNTLLRHITSALPPRTYLQHSQLQYTAATKLLQHIYCNTLLHHTTAPQFCTTLLHHAYCTTRMQRHTTARHCCNILLGPYPLAHICSINNLNKLPQYIPAAHLLQHATATHYCNTH